MNTIHNDFPIPGMQHLFEEKFGEPATIIARAPGRINFIGEHTDYNEGFVLPAAIDKSVKVAISKRPDDAIRLFAVQYDEYFETSLSEIHPQKNHWSNYSLGVVDQLLKKDIPLTGLNILLDGDVPLGAGMSSSAAVECAVAIALNKLFSVGLSSLQLALLAQATEHRFAGVQCGIMDQYSSIFGKKNNALKLDCRALVHEYIPIDLQDYKIVLFDSNVKHSLASSEYNIRRQQCEAGVSIIRQKHPAVNSLRDADIFMVRRHIADPIIRKRCEYVVKENNRLQEACDKLLSGDIIGFGNCMFQTHQGLSEDYDVSCPELDFLVSSVKANPAVAGARMMGGGFGGCTINIIKAGKVEEVTSSLSEAYHKKMGRTLTSYWVNIDEGARVC